MKPLLFKQLLIGQHFHLNGVEYIRVETYYENCCVPEYNFMEVNDETKRGLMKPHSAVEVDDDKQGDT